MNMENPFLVVEIPQYIRSIKIANSRNAIYYECGINREVLLKKGKKVKQQYLHNHAKTLVKAGKTLFYIYDFVPDKYTIGIYKGTILVDWLLSYTHVSTNAGVSFVSYKDKNVKFRVIDIVTKKPIIVNEKTVGTPRHKIISGQDIYNGTIRPEMRASIMQAIKEDYISKMPVLPVIEKSLLPCLIQLTVYDVIGDGTWDIDNRSFLYSKAFNDLMSKGTTGKKNGNKLPIKYFTPILPDDNVKFVTQAGGARFIEVEKEEERKLVFSFYKDNYVPQFKINKQQKLWD